MTANSKNRETVRDALAALLNTALVGENLPAAVVANYELGKIGATPLVMVLSAGSRRQQHGMNQEKWSNQFRLVVRVVVRDASTSDSWTEQNVEDTLDEIEQKIANVLADNRSTANWHYITFEDDFSIIGPAQERPYVIEELRVLVDVYDA